MDGFPDERVHRYNAAGLEGLTNHSNSGGPPRKLTREQETAFAEWVREGPKLEEHKVVRWRRGDLREEIARRFGVEMHERTVGKLLARLSFSRVSVRPRHPEQDMAAQEAHTKNSLSWSARRHLGACPGQADRALVARRACHAVAIVARTDGATMATPSDNGARVGQQGCLTYVWADKGSRPRAPRDQRHASAYLFGAVCPARGNGAALMLPGVNIEAMNLRLAEISTQIAPRRTRGHRARWRRLASARRRSRRARQHQSDALPPYSPKLNPVENIWQYLRQNYLANRVFETYDTIVDACCDAWNALVAQPDTINSIASREWAQAVIA